MPAVFAHAGDVALDVARVEGGVVEGRVEELNEPGLSAHESFIDGVHAGGGAFGIAGARDDRPALRQGIDLAFRVFGGAERGAVVEIGAAIPLAVPGIFLDVFLQLRGVGGAMLGEGSVVAAAGEFGELHQHIVEEESQPDAFAASMFADEIHAVVPIAAADEREAVGAEFEAVIDGAHAVLVERGGFSGVAWKIVVGFLLGFDRASFEEGDAFVEHAGVVEAEDVAAGGIGEPEVIVGKMRAHAAARGRMPPMLHVAFAELMGGGAEEVFAEETRFGVDQRHAILQLIAEAEGAAGLIEAGARPDAATERLVEASRWRGHRGRGRVFRRGRR